MVSPAETQETTMSETFLQGAAAKQVAADGLRAAILNGDMSPGQRLVESELVELYAVTRSSLRAAMEDLVAEGLVERIPNKGARVRVVSLEEAVSILECRGVLDEEGCRRTTRDWASNATGRCGRGADDVLTP